MKKTWFSDLFGFEENVESVYENLYLEDGYLYSNMNGISCPIGTFNLVNEASLQNFLDYSGNKKGKLLYSEVTADVADLITNPNNAGATFQVASQFNCLEMVGPNVTPSDGVSIYEYDLTQGPACAIACGADTVYRNYFVNHRGNRGQLNEHLWEPFAKAILRTSYRLTFMCALTNKKSNKLYLTSLGGGAFGNPREWIKEAIETTLQEFQHYDLDVYMVKYPNDKQTGMLKAS